MIKNNKNIKSLIKEMRNASKYLTEDFIFNNDDDVPMNDDFEGQGGMERPHMQQPQQGHMDNGQGGEQENAEQQAMHAHEIIQHEPIIAKIRETAITGLKKYSEDIESEIYQFFKKVFLEADKVLEGNGNKGNG